MSKKEPRNIMKVIYEHWLAIFGAISAIAIASLMQYFRVIDLIFLLNEGVSFLKNAYFAWGVVLVLILFGMYRSYKDKKDEEQFSITFVNSPPRHKKGDFKDFTEYGVTWKAWAGVDTLFTYDDSEELRVWVEGPFCPDCMYELDVNYRKNEWSCALCQKRYRIPSQLSGDYQEKMIKIIEGLRRKSKQQNTNG